VIKIALVDHEEHKEARRVRGDCTGTSAKVDGYGLKPVSGLTRLFSLFAILRAHRVASFVNEGFSLSRNLSLLLSGFLLALRVLSFVVFVIPPPALTDLDVT
jgi:hypothetical protein